MSIEYEAKVGVEDLNMVEERLQTLGAQLIDIVDEEDTYIDLNPCIDMALRDVALRIRIYRSVISNRERCELTYKGPRKSRDLKIRKEITVAIDSGYKAIDIFRELGFRSITIYKRRKIYRYGVAKIFLDDVKGLGKFVEIEIENVNSIDEFREILTKILDTLNLPKQLIPKSYLEIMLARSSTVSL